MPIQSQFDDLDVSPPALPDVSRLALIRSSTLTETFGQLGLNSEYIRYATERCDNLRSPLIPTRRTLFSDEPADIALRLLFCGVTAGKDEAESALGAKLVEELREAGLLQGSPYMAPFHLRSAGGLFLFSDYLTGHLDAVMGAGETTAVLYSAARPMLRLESVFDLGCGAGTLALLLASFAGHSIGSDVNPRAIALARCNAAINGIHNVEFRLGSLYEPVGDERFHLIVSQPPYYPTTKSGRTAAFLHGGPRGDEIASKVVKGLLEHLEHQGRALVFTSWPADAPPVAHHEMRSLELRTDRGELTGTRQSINVVEHLRGKQPWAASLDIAPDVWNAINAMRIDEWFAGQDLLVAGQQAVLHSVLKLSDGLRLISEGSQRLIVGAAVGMTPVEDEMAAMLGKFASATSVKSATAGPETIALVQEALRRGWLCVR